MALAGIGGLGIGILGTALVMSKSRKKKEETAE
jgi:F0F1-type ATP synthase membrane subunit c/vacuolar-type H+-ATPase subunit K